MQREIETVIQKYGMVNTGGFVDPNRRVTFYHQPRGPHSLALCELAQGGKVLHWDSQEHRLDRLLVYGLDGRQQEGLKLVAYDLTEKLKGIDPRTQLLIAYALALGGLTQNEARGLIRDRFDILPNFYESIGTLFCMGANVCIAKSVWRIGERDYPLEEKVLIIKGLQEEGQWYQGNITVIETQRAIGTLFPRLCRPDGVSIVNLREDYPGPAGLPILFQVLGEAIYTNKRPDIFFPKKPLINPQDAILRISN